MLKISLKQLFLAEAVGFVLSPESRMNTGLAPYTFAVYPFSFP
jgi:hypothetical protein